MYNICIPITILTSDITITTPGDRCNERRFLNDIQKTNYWYLAIFMVLSNADTGYSIIQ